MLSFSVEGTVAGVAAGFVAWHPEKLSEIAYRSKWLEIRLENGETDMALVDVAVVQGQAIGSKAIWEPEKLQQAILTRAEPTTTGIAGMSGFIQPLSPYEPRGLSLRFGEPRVCRATAPFAPGLMATVGVEEILNLSIGDVLIVEGGPSILALDGEREILLRRGQSAQITLRQNGPWIVDVFQALQMAARQKFLVS
jgi:hypothetical protein